MNNQEYQIQRLTTLDEMKKHHSLINQFYPKLDEQKYISRLQEMIPKGYKQVGVFHQNQCVAVSGYWILTRLYCGRYIDVDNFIVDQQHRSAGIGKQLLHWMEEEGRQLGCRFSILDAYVENSGAHKFYHREGYQVRGFHFLKRL